MKNEAAKNPPITRIWRTFVTSRQGSTLGKEASLFFNQGFFFGFDQGTDALTSDVEFLDRLIHKRWISKVNFLVLPFCKLVILGGEIDDELDGLCFGLNLVAKDILRQPVEATIFFDAVIGFLRENRVFLAEADKVADKLDMILIAQGPGPIQLVDVIRDIIGVINAVLCSEKFLTALNKDHTLTNQYKL